MAIDWDKFQESLDEEIETAARRTSAKLASEASSVTRLTDEEVKKLFPTPADVQKLKDLMEIVKSADTQNQRVNRLAENIEDLAGVTLTLLAKFA